MKYWDDDSDSGETCVGTLPATNYLPSFGPPCSVESQNQAFPEHNKREKSKPAYNKDWNKRMQESASLRLNERSNSNDTQTRNRRERSFQNNYRGRDRNEIDKFKSHEEESNSNLTFFLSQNFVGRVIGSGGKTIKRIQEQSGCRIKIFQRHTEEGDAEVTIFGTPDAQLQGKCLIDEITQETQNMSLNEFSNDRRHDFNRRNYQSDRRWKGNDSQFNGFRTDVSCNSRSERYPKNEGSYNDHTFSRDNIISEENVSQKIDWANVNKKHEEYMKEKWGAIPDIVKNFYVEDDEIANMDEADVAEFRLCYNNIKITNLSEDPDRLIPNPVKTFEHAFMPFPEILKEIEAQHFEKPSPIQCQTWPIIMQGIDCIGIAQTGTGKTLAFLLPALIHIDLQPKPRQGPTVLILCPTRELAIQVFEEAKKYSYKGITCGCLYGGASRKEQTQLVKEGLDIVVGTPGRLSDLIESEILNVLYITYVVMDEADRMLDLGFEPQIRKVLYMVRPDRQTIMTTATWPEAVHDLAKSFSKDPLQVHIGSLDLAAVQTVEQIIDIVEEDEKKGKLFQFLYDLKPDEKVMVFADRKATVDDVASDLALKEFPYAILHSGIEQEDREQALEDFKIGVVNILIATDVVSRGIDVKDVTYVYNYDFPVNIEEYVHRVGRTGRAGKTGKAITLMSWGDRRKAAALIKILEKAKAEIPQGLLRMADKYEKQAASRPPGRGFHRGGRGRKSWN